MRLSGESRGVRLPAPLRHRLAAVAAQRADLEGRPVSASEVLRAAIEAGLPVVEAEVYGDELNPTIPEGNSPST